jgi:hypothetical protein
MEEALGDQNVEAVPGSAHAAEDSVPIEELW